jgi:predicted transposase YdaD
VINGVYLRQFPDAAEPYRLFRYQVVRVWELPVESLLRGGLGTLPLAPISAVTEAQLPDVIRRMRERLDLQKQRARAERLWTAAYVLMGLRYEAPMIDHLLKEVLGMEESTTYQAIIQKGEAKGTIKGIRLSIYALGEKQFGVPAGARVKKAVEAIATVDELLELSTRLLTAHSWEELLNLPGPRSRRRKTKE